MQKPFRRMVALLLAISVVSPMGAAMHASAAEPVEGTDVTATSNAKYDVDGNGKINILDILEAQKYYGARSTDVNWNDIQKYNVNGDDAINLRDLIDILLHYGTVTPEVPDAEATAIYNGKIAAPILMDAAYETSESDAYAQRTYTQVSRAVSDLRQDIAMVTGAIDFEEVQQILDDTDEQQEQRLEGAEDAKVPDLITDWNSVDTGYAIMVGTIGDSHMIEALMTSGKLDEAKTIEGAWEAYVIKEVENPVEGVDKALVVAGSDARGTVYGIYSISEMIGVSPWYWWSDVPVDVAETISLNGLETIVDDGPDVKYRGIFINDEEQLREWAYHKEEYGWPNQVSDPAVYTNMFELLLRLKANTLWPAMHEGTVAFNNVVDAEGNSINAQNAAEYGIIMSAAHCEMMLRNNVGEWESWWQANRQKYNIIGNNMYEAWDYTINKTAILAYWEERIIANKDYESIFPVGLRGVHDGGPTLSQLDQFIANQGQENGLGTEITVEGTSTEAKQAALMKDVINEQRKLIAKHYGTEDGAPQVFIPYKEMNDYYNMNDRDLADWLAENAPDVILMWSNDNQQYLRQVPNEQEREEGRVNGIYYHNSYWGTPRSWLWLNAPSISLMDSEMHRAYNTGADYYWILNVGDIKPGEIPMEYFMDMAWDVNAYTDETMEENLAKIAARDYNVSSALAAEIADGMVRYYQYNGTKRAEYYGSGYDFNVFANGDEGMLWLNQWNELEAHMTAIYHQLDADAKDAFYEQILHGVQSCRAVAAEYVYYAKNQLAVSQGRFGSAMAYRELGLQAIQDIKDYQNDFWTLNEGKWEYVINYSHEARYRTEPDEDHWVYYQGNQGITLKNSSDYTLPAMGEGVGAAAENTAEAGSGALYFSSLQPEMQHYFDVFSKASEVQSWTAAAPVWLTLSKTTGATNTEERVLVTVDWSQLTETTTGEILVYNGADTAGEPVAAFTVTATVENSQLSGDTKGYQEANGYVMIEAEHWSSNTPGADGTQWQVVTDLGQRGDSIRVMSEDGKVDQTKGDIATYQTDATQGASVTYNVYFNEAGTYELIAYRMPTLDEGTMTCETYLTVHGSTQVIRGNASTGGSWGANIVRMIEPISMNITVEQGWNTITIRRASASMAFDRFLILTDETMAPPVTEIGLGMPTSPNNVVDAAQLTEFQTMRVAALPQELANWNIIMGESVSVAVDAEQTVEAPAGYTITAVDNTNPTAADAVLNDGVLTITGKRSGTAELTLTLSDGTETGRGVVMLTVTPSPNGNGAYQIVDGKLVIDTADAMAEDNGYAYATDRTTHHWELKLNGVQCAPDNGTFWTDTNTVPNVAPALTYVVNVTDETAGTYYVYLNRTTPNTAGNGDSFFVRLDNGPWTQITGDCVDDWSNTVGTWNLTAGTHTIAIYAREDGIMVNQIYLTRTAGMPANDTFLTPTQREQAVPSLTLGDIDDQVMTTTGALVLPVEATLHYAEGAVTLTAQSDDPAVATVAVEGESIRITPAAAGETVITVTANAADLSAAVTFTVTVREAAEDDDYAYYIEDGKVVINAADALDNKFYAYTQGNGEHTWAAKEDDLIWLTPNVSPNGGVWTATDAASLSNTPSMTFKIYAPEGGTYYLSAYTANPDIDSDSFHVGVNGTYSFSSNADYNPANADQWYTFSNRALTLHAGENRITIWAREDGVSFRQIMLSTEQPTDLSGMQTATEPSAPKALVYQPESNGNIVINAADVLDGQPYAQAVGTASHSWISDGENGVELSPDNGGTWTATDAASLGNAPSMTFQVHVPSAGTYYLSAYTNHPDSSADSFHVGVNGQYGFSTNNTYTFAHEYQWYAFNQALSLQEGLNTITVWAREDGACFKQLLLSTTVQSDLSGWQETTQPSPLP